MFWSKVKNLLDSDGVPTQPRHLIVDFEKAAINGFSNRFNDTIVSGCFFHLRKNLHSQLGEKGALVDYNESRAFQNLTALMYSLAFVPVDDIVPLWQQIVEPEMYKMQDDINEEMDAYIDYFHDTYIGKNLRNGRRGRPLFAYALWNKYQDVIDEVPATNNRVEAWNGAWNKSQQSSASLWTVIDGFKREDGLARQKWMDDNRALVDANDPWQGNMRRVSVKLKYQRLKEVCLQYTNYQNKRLYLAEIISIMEL